MNGPTIKVMYSCHKCGLKDREVVVRERRSDEDVVAWVNHAAILMGADHHRASPKCRITSLDEVKIPVPTGTHMVGRVPRQ